MKRSNKLDGLLHFLKTKLYLSPKNYLKNLVGKLTPKSIIPLKADRLLLKKELPSQNKKQRMNKVQTLKNRIRQRLGLNYVAYMGNPECNEDWLKGYDQAKKDVFEAIHQIEIYMPYLDED